MLQFENRHFLTGEELSRQELIKLISHAEVLRQRREQRRGQKSSLPLKGKTLALIFDKPSLRTRVSFTVGIQELGGGVMELLGSQKKNEEPEDTIRVLQGMVHGLMVRTFEHQTLERMVAKAKIPIINGLSDSHHPCQALADILTLHQRFGALKGLKLAYIGDGNNVLHSLLLLAPFLGIDVHYACPDHCGPVAAILERAHRRAHIGGAQIRAFADPREAVVNAHAVYTDVWTSMGAEDKGADRIRMFQGYQLNLDLFSRALPNAIAMHCLPMVRGQEISMDVAEHPRSAIFQQSENRLHAQKALLVGLFHAAASVTKGFEYSHVI